MIEISHRGSNLLYSVRNWFALGLILFMSAIVEGQVPELLITKVQDVSCSYTFPCDGTATVAVNWNGLPEPSDFTLTWSSSETGNEAAFLCEGWQVVTLTFGANLIRDSIEMFKPLPITYSLDVQHEKCLGSSDGSLVIENIDGGQPPYSTVWSIGALGPELLDLSNGTYTAILSDGNQCQVTVQTEIFSGVDVALTIDSTASTPVECYGDSNANLLLTVANFIEIDSYQWFPDVSDFRYGLGLSAGVYKIFATSSEGCVDSVVYEVISPDSLRLEVTFDSLVCEGATTIVDVVSEGGSGTISLAFNNMQFEDSIVAAAGIYQILLTDSLGCSTEQQLSISEYEPTMVFMPSDITILAGDSVYLDIEYESNYGVDTILWSNTAYADCGSCSEQLIYGEENEDILLSFIDVNGCKEDHSLRVDIDLGGDIEFSNILSPNGDGKNDQFILNFEFPFSTLQSFRVFDRYGNLIYQQNDSQISPYFWDPSQATSTVSDGVYVFVAELLNNDKEVYHYYGDVTISR